MSSWLPKQVLPEGGLSLLSAAARHPLGCRTEGQTCRSRGTGEGVWPLQPSSCRPVTYRMRKAALAYLTGLL